jgi:DNA-binding GntR family transcriptional regulator
MSSAGMRDHEAIFEAVSAGNARKASAAMTRHLGNIRDVLMKTPWRALCLIKTRRLARDS